METSNRSDLHSLLVHGYLRHLPRILSTLVPQTVLYNIFFFFRPQPSFLVLIGGSEECKDVSYNELQVLPLRSAHQPSSDDIKPIIYRLHPQIWRKSTKFDSSTKRTNIP